MTEKNNIYIEDVVDVKELQTLQDNWAKATDLAFVTVDCNGTPITKQSNFTPFCKRLRELDAFREKCYYCDACGGRKARRIGKAYVYICHAGLIDFAIPIMIKGQYVGAFLAGQVTSTDFADLKKITTQSEDWKDNQELVELYNQVKEVSVEKIQAVAQIICDSYNYSVEREYANKVDAELREKDYKLMKEEKLRIEMEKSLRDIELKALHYQINPHFLFNVLNTIGRLAFFENAKMTEDVVYAFADMIGEAEKLSEEKMEILRAAALVHDIGIRVAEEKYGSCSGKLQEKEGPAIAEKMLDEVGYPVDAIRRICYLVGHHHTYTNIDGLDYRILVEADFLVNLFENESSRHAMRNADQKVFETETGKRILHEMFALNDGAEG